MIKKLLNYFFILVAVATTSFTFTMEKELPEPKQVPALSELATRKIVINLIALLNEDLESYKNPYLLKKQVHSKFLSELKRLSQQLPAELFLPIINFNLQSVVPRAPKTFLLSVLYALPKYKDYQIISLLLPILEELLRLGADALITGGRKYTPLMAAIAGLPETEESLSFLQMLVNSGADVNAAYKNNDSKKNETAIFIAAFKPRFLDFLIKAGADVNKGQLNDNGTIFRTPLDNLDFQLEKADDSQTKKRIQQSITILKNAGGKRNKDLIFGRG